MNEVEFIKTLERMNRNHIPFSNQFQETLKHLESILRLEIIATNISLMVESPKPHYQGRLKELDATNSLSAIGIENPRISHTFQLIGIRTPYS